MFRILHLEDCSNDAFLIEQAVKNEGIKAEFKVVKNLKDFICTLEQEEFDLILADSGVPACEGISALEVARRKCPHIGFICLSGLENPAHIKACFDAGANDYISKNDLPRLMATLRWEVDRYGR